MRSLQDRSSTPWLDDRLTCDSWPCHGAASGHGSPWEPKGVEDNSSGEPMAPNSLRLSGIGTVGQLHTHTHTPPHPNPTTSQKNIPRTFSLLLGMCCTLHGSIPTSSHPNIIGHEFWTANPSMPTLQTAHGFDSQIRSIPTMFSWSANQVPLGQILC